LQRKQQQKQHHNTANHARFVSVPRKPQHGNHVARRQQLHRRVGGAPLHPAHNVDRLGSRLDMDVNLLDVVVANCCVVQVLQELRRLARADRQVATKALVAEDL